MYKNGEGYNDPTAGAAMGQIMKEYRQQRRREWQRETEIKERPKAYIVSKYAGDVEKNVKKACSYSRFALRQKRIPIASHLLFPQFMDDNDQTERKLGLLFGHALLAMCDEVWVFGTEYSEGMQAEIREAKRLGKTIKYYDERMAATNETH